MRPIWKRALQLSLLAPALAVLVIARGKAAEQPPNILFVVMDDVGIDQMKVFGYGGATPPSMPTIEQVAGAGVRFSNAWSMPACTTSRGVFFTGRFPLRTNVQGALGPSDLANSMVSPYEMTAPKLLKQRGYQSALFGKFHLGLQGNNPFHESMVRSLGWDYYYGWLDETGDPSSIDTTAGGVGENYSCGFVPSAADGGADEGACYMPDGSCHEMTSVGPVPPGRICRDAGGIFDPTQAACQSSLPDYIKFERLNGHYVSPLTIAHEDGTVEDVPATDMRARRYRGSTVVDAAVAWIKQQPKDKPWMATVSFASAHTPVMQPPAPLVRSIDGLIKVDDCADQLKQRVLSNQMIEAMDTEIGRLLVDTGLATRGEDGTLVYRPDNSDTMIVIVGDNGSFPAGVKYPFNPNRAKGTAYQTGVWVPLVVAGPLVQAPDRQVRHMVNIADLYQLFGEIAGVDARKNVPRPIDSVGMLPYLLKPNQGSLRAVNFTQVGPNIQAGDALNGPCIINDSCTQIPVTKEVCQDNGGTWWGADSDIEGLPEGGLTQCCQVNQFLHDTADPGETVTYYSIQPLTSMAVRNGTYKVVRNYKVAYNETDNRCEEQTTNEFYQIDERKPTPTIDEPELELTALGPLTAEQQKNYDALTRQMNAILDSAVKCQGDGNSDGVVNDRDIEQWAFYSGPSGGGSSWYDFNHDGLTDSQDLQTIMDNFGRCKK